MKDLYSIDLCFGKQDHLYIKGPILIPYVEQEEEINSHSYTAQDSNGSNNKNEESSKIIILIKN